MLKENSGKSNSRGKTISRRSFLMTTTAASAAFTIIPSVAMGRKLGYQAPSDTLNVALVGAGSQGSGDIGSICVPDNNHYLDWVAACKDPDLRNKIASHFGEAGPFNEMVLMGVLAVRLQKLNRILDWDGENMQFTNISDTDRVSIFSQTMDMGRMMAQASSQARTAGGAAPARGGAPAGGPGGPAGQRPADPSVVSAKEFVTSLIRHEYLNGYKLPDMPA